jgi:hypothetical protein
MTLLGRYRTVFTGVAGSPWYSNMYFDENVAEGAIYGAYIDQFWEACGVEMRTDVQWQVEPTVIGVDDTTGEVYGAANWAGATGAGDSNNDALPRANQMYVRWTTGQWIGGTETHGPRQLQGRTFIPGLVETTNEAGTPSAAARTAIAAAATELISDGNGAFRVFSPTHTTSAIINGSSVASKFGVLRSRRD